MAVRPNGNPFNLRRHFEGRPLPTRTVNNTPRPAPRAPKPVKKPIK